MSDLSGHHQSGAADEAIPFRDEIFNWPIARLNNVDVWDFIFKKYVTHPTDQNNLIVASPQFFGPLLKDKKCSNLFGEVLDILHRRHYLALSKKEFLHFRGLSKTCKKSIDTVVRINNHCGRHHSGIEHDTSDPKHVCWNQWRFPFLSELERSFAWQSNMNLQDGLLQFGAVLPGLSIGYHDMNEYPNLQALLSPIGTQIYHLFTYVDWSSHTWKEGYHKLHTLLRIMPNLVSLKISGWSNDDDEDAVDKNKGCLMELSQYVEENPLPSLNRLIYLRVARTPMEVTNALYAKCAAKLEKLSMTFFEPSINAFLHSSDLFSKANVLTDLQIFSVPNGPSRSLTLNPKWPASLRNVCLSVACGRFEHENFQPFCNALLEQFARANHRLRSFSIDIFQNYNYCNPADRIVSTDFRIRLPYLRRLWIRCCLLFIDNIDFILGVSNSLEELVLNLSWTAPLQESAEEIILFKGYWHKMYESNIWEKMPKLQKLTIRSRQIIREGYSPPVNKEYEYFRANSRHSSVVVPETAVSEGIL